MKYLWENSSKKIYPDSITSNAAKSGNLECLKFILEHGGKAYSYTCSEVAYRGHLECLKYLH